MPLLFWLNHHLHHSAPRAQARQHTVSWICQGLSVLSYQTLTFYMPFPPPNLHMVQSSFPRHLNSFSNAQVQIKQVKNSLAASPLRLMCDFFLPISSSNIIPLSRVAKVKAHPAERNPPPANWIIKSSTIKCSNKRQNDSSGYIFNSLHVEERTHLLRVQLHLLTRVNGIFSLQPIFMPSKIIRCPEIHH